MSSKRPRAARSKIGRTLKAKPGTKTATGERERASSLFLLPFSLYAFRAPILYLFSFVASDEDTIPNHCRTRGSRRAAPVGTPGGHAAARGGARMGAWGLHRRARD